MFYDFQLDSISEEENLTLSKETIGKLVTKLTLEVIDYIVNNPKTNQFLHDMVTEALCEKLGNKNDDGS